MSATDRPSCIVFGVTGSIAACKAAQIVSELVKAGMDVFPVLTESATRLVSARTFQTLARHPVVTSLWDQPDWQPGHVALAERADLLVVAPATANILAKMARGIADDALSTQALAHEGTVLVAPAMNPRMWRHPAVQANVRILRERGVRFIGPDSGDVACGAPGEGRMVDPMVIAEAVRAQCLALRTPRLSGRTERLLVTAGPTCEDIDRVRFLTNHSSGRMGYAIAAMGVAAGMEVTLISGPCDLSPPPECAFVPVRSAADMAAAVRDHFPAADWLAMSAAVADFRPTSRREGKIAKSGNALDAEFERTEDILEWVSNHRSAHQTVVGFAAEVDDLEERATEKLVRKRLDWIAANDVSRDDVGFAGDNNELLLLSHSRRIAISAAPKLEIAARLLSEIAHDARSSSAQNGL